MRSTLSARTTRRMLSLSLACLLALQLGGCWWQRDHRGQTALAPMAPAGDHATPQPLIGNGAERLTAPTGLDCPLAGRWLVSTPQFGTTTLNIASQDDGHNRVTQDGDSNFEGNAESRGKTVQILFHTSIGHAGIYEWTLDEACREGHGKLTFTAGAHGEYLSSTKHLP